MGKPCDKGIQNRVGPKQEERPADSVLHKLHHSKVIPSDDNSEEMHTRSLGMAPTSRDHAYAIRQSPVMW